MANRFEKQCCTTCKPASRIINYVFEKFTMHKPKTFPSYTLRFVVWMKNFYNDHTNKHNLVE